MREISLDFIEDIYGDVCMRSRKIKSRLLSDPNCEEFEKELLEALNELDEVEFTKLDKNEFKKISQITK